MAAKALMRITKENLFSWGVVSVIQSDLNLKSGRREKIRIFCKTKCDEKFCVLHRKTKKNDCRTGLSNQQKKIN